MCMLTQTLKTERGFPLELHSLYFASTRCSYLYHRRTLLDSMQTQEYDCSDRSNRISVLHGEKKEENPSNFTLGPSKTQEMEFDTSDDLV